MELEGGWVGGGSGNCRRQFLRGKSCRMLPVVVRQLPDTLDHTLLSIHTQGQLLASTLSRALKCLVITTHLILNITFQAFVQSNNQNFPINMSCAVQLISLKSYHIIHQLTMTFN
jgi:hypothetical protein